MKHREKISRGRRATRAVLLAVTTLMVGGLALVLGFGVSSIQGPNLTTDTWSVSLHSEVEKVAFLDRYVGYASAVQAAEFHVTYQDNSAIGCIGPPGPSDWEIEAAIRIAPADVPRWVGGMEPIETEDPVDVSWGRALLPASWGLSPTATMLVYKAADRRSSSSGEILAVFPVEGVVFMCNWGH